MELPSAFILSIKDVPGFNAASFKDIHNSGRQVTSVRLNTAKKINPQNFIQGVTLQQVPWCTNGFYLSERPSFTTDPLFHAGAYYVQEASSMFLEQALQQTCNLTQPLKVLDLCAAPGGKSTLIQSLLSKESLLVSNEVIKSRVTVLAENITKWGACNTIVTNNDAKDFQRLPNYFDVIVVDAPCSGSGLFRKDHAAVDEWSEQNVQLCCERQQRILTDILPSLKHDGTLIYSTCSYSTAENEAIVDWLIQACSMETIQLQTATEWNIVETASDKQSGYGYRFYPDRLKGEGFFIAAFKKGGESNYNQPHFNPRNKTEKLSLQHAAIVNPFLKNPEELFFIQQMEDVLAFPKPLEMDFYLIQSTLYIKKAGVKTGSIIRNELIPDHALAMSTNLNSLLPAIEADYENALQYLRKQEIKIDTNTKGWALISYKQLPLGWAKILPNRINNYYPRDWRILNK